MLRKDSLDFVVPVYNEAECLPALMARLLAIQVSMSDVELRFVFVNDGSRDGSLDLLIDYANEFPSVGLISLSRNFGHQTAVTAGLDHANADYVCIIDADLQDPPELVEAMYRRAKAEKLNVLYGLRRGRPGETVFKRASAAAFYRLLQAMCQVEIPRNTGDFRLMDRKVVEAVRQMRETHRFLRGMVPWVGFKTAPFLYEREPRHAGETKYPLRKMLRLAADAIFSFSRQPLRWASYAGLVVIGAGSVGLLYMFYLMFFTSRAVTELVMILTAISIVGGFQILMLGVMGDYLGRVYEEAKRRPLYFVDLSKNLDLAGNRPTDVFPYGSH